MLPKQLSFLKRLAQLAQIFLAFSAAAAMSSPIPFHSTSDVGDITKQSNGVLDSESQPPNSYVDSDISVYFINNSAKANMTEIVLKKSGYPDKTINLSAELKPLTQIRRAGDKILFTGIINSASLAGVGIIDIKTEQLSDYFWAYQPSPSPDGNFFAFIKFYPSHFIADAESQYRLYDLRRSADENRPSLHLPVKEGALAPDPINDVGIPVYSLKPGEINRSNVILPEDNIPEESIHRVKSKFFWSTDSSKFVFSDYQGTTISAVTVSVPVGMQNKVVTEVYKLTGKRDICRGNCDAILNDTGIFKFIDGGVEYSYQDSRDPGQSQPKPIHHIFLPFERFRLAK
jgi:hypothetical protein